MYPVPAQVALPNGVTVLTVTQHESSTVTALVLMRVGSRFESDSQRGLAHFTEHMVFKGGIQYPTAQSIARTMDGIGGEFNAFTSQEFTGFYTKTAVQHAEVGVSILSDMLLRATFPEEELEKEKGVIVEEINMYADMPMRKVDDVLADLLYGDTPLGRPILGTKESVNSFHHEDFVKYREQFYVGDACTVVFAGAISPEDSQKLAQQYFGELPAGPKVDPVVATVADGVRTAHLVRESEQSHFMITFPALTQTDPRRYAQKILATILGGPMSSRMFERVREQQGLCYYVRSYVDNTLDTGVIVTNAGVDNARLDQAINSVTHELELMRAEGPTEEEVARAKEYLLGRQLLGLETSDALGEFYGGQLVMEGSTRTPEEIAAAVSAVTREEVVQLAHELIQPSEYRLAVVGPKQVYDCADLLPKD